MHLCICMNIVCITVQRMAWKRHTIRTFRKHTYSNILKISSPKAGSFQIKIDIFHISAQNIDCEYSLEPPRRGGSNEYPQSMFLSRTKKNDIYPCKPQFYYIKVGYKGVKIIWVCFYDEIITTMPGRTHQTQKQDTERDIEDKTLNK